MDGLISHLIKCNVPTLLHLVQQDIVTIFGRIVQTWLGFPPLYAALTTPFQVVITKIYQSTLGMTKSPPHKQEVEKRSENERRKCWQTATIQQEETPPL